MAYFPSYNKFRTEVQETQSTTSAAGPNGVGLAHKQAYAFSDASWSRGQTDNPSGFPARQGQMPGELFSMLQPASFTSLEPPMDGYASRYFYNVSPGIINNGGPTSNWNNPRNAIGFDFVGRTSLVLVALPGNGTFYLGAKPPQSSPTAPGTVQGVIVPGGGPSQTTGQGAVAGTGGNNNTTLSTGGGIGAGGAQGAGTGAPQIGLGY